MTTTVELASLRSEFPITEEWAFLNHANFGPFPRRTVAAITGVAEALQNAPERGSAYNDTLELARANAARLVGGTPAGIAFVGSLADAMSLAAAGIGWKAGDNVVMPTGEFPSNVYPFLNQERFGVEVRMVDKGDDGFTDLDRLFAAVDDRTRALVISHIEFATGFRNDLDAIGRFCRERGILSVVDATQSMGATPIDVQRSGIDVIAAHGYKWLMSSFGLAVAHFSEQAIQAIHPVYVGRLSVQANYDAPEFRLDLQPDARRYQTGGITWLGTAAFNASCELVLAAEPQRTAQHCVALTGRLLEEVATMGYTVTSSLDPAHRSQIVSFTSGSRDEDSRIVERFEAANVSVSLRTRGVRVSPYFYNTDGDIDRLLEALPPH